MYVYIIYVQVWVSDQGFTDESYKDELTARAEIPVVIRPVNDRYIYIYIYRKREREREGGGGQRSRPRHRSSNSYIYMYIGQRSRPRPRSSSSRKPNIVTWTSFWNAATTSQV